MWVQYNREIENAWTDQIYCSLPQEGNLLHSWMVPTLVNGTYQDKIRLKQTIQTVIGLPQLVLINWKYILFSKYREVCLVFFFCFWAFLLQSSRWYKWFEVQNWREENIIKLHQIVKKRSGLHYVNITDQWPNSEHWAIPENLWECWHFVLGNSNSL